MELFEATHRELADAGDAAPLCLRGEISGDAVFAVPEAGDGAAELNTFATELKDGGARRWVVFGAPGCELGR